MHPKLQQLAASINAAHLANEQGDFKQAEQLCKKALKIDKMIPEAWYNLGIALRGLDHKKEAIRAQREAMKLARDSADAQNSIGLELLELGEHRDAETALRRALRIDPNHAFAYSNLGKLFTAQKKHTEALAASERAYQLSPDHPKILVNLGASFNAVKEFQKAKSLLKKAISLDNKSAEAFNNLGSTFSGLNRFEEAERQLRKAIALAPNFEHAWTNLGGALNELMRPKEAESALRHAIKLDPHSAEAFSNLSSVFSNQNLHEEAKLYAQRALELDPFLSSAKVNLALALSTSGDKKTAEEILSSVLEIDPREPEANHNLSHLLFGQNRFDEGWPHYEYRFSIKKATLIRPLENAPRWDGVLHDELRLLVIAEQGIGDEVLYAHFLQQLNETDTAKPITVTADARLIPIYQRSFSKLRFLDRKQLIEGEKFNAQIPLASLGKLFLNDKDDFAKTQHPYLKFDSSHANQLRKKITRRNRILCGLSWSSKNKDIGQPKSLGLHQLAPILTLPNLQFVNLQYGDVREQIEEIERKLDIEILQIDEIDNTNDIDGLLSLISACDFVVTTSNVTTHLAGAINKETYQLSPKGNGKFWYWKNQDEQGHSLWYPSVKIIEQEEIGDWSAPIAKLKTILENR
jgi:tetratricopeptide (TPR) repeat protein